MVNNTPVVTHLIDNDCLLIPYTRITLRAGDNVDLGKLLKDRRLREVEGVAYDYAIILRIGGERYVITVIDTAVPWGTVAAGELSEDYVTFSWYHIEDRLLRIVKPLKGVEKLEEAASRLMGRLPLVEYTRAVDGSLEGTLLRRIILGTAISYYPGFSYSGSIYLCSNGVIMPSAEGEDCALIQFEKSIADESTFFDFINEFSLIGADVGVLMARSAMVYPVTVKLKSAYGDAAAYALIMPDRYRRVLDRYRRVDDTVLVSTPSLRRLLNRIMNAISSVQGDELLSEAGLT